MAEKVEIALKIEGLKLDSDKAVKGYMLVTEEGKEYFITPEEYERLRQEILNFEKAYLSQFHPEIVTKNSVVTQTSSQHMKQIRETLNLPPPTTVGPSAATLAAISAMQEVDWEAEALHTLDRVKAQAMDATAWTGRWQLPSVEELDVLLAPDEEVSLKKK